MKCVTGRLFWWSNSFSPYVYTPRYPHTSLVTRLHWIPPALWIPPSQPFHPAFPLKLAPLNCTLPLCKSLCNVSVSLRDRSSHARAPLRRGTDTSRFSFCNLSHKSWNMVTNPRAASVGKALPRRVWCCLASLPWHTRQQAARGCPDIPPASSANPFHRTLNIRPTLQWPTLRKWESHWKIPSSSSQSMCI